MKRGHLAIMAGILLVMLDLVGPSFGLTIIGSNDPDDYWYESLVMTHEGIDIYEFPNIGVFGFTFNGKDYFYGNLLQATQGIDNMIQDPTAEGSYRMFNIFREPAGAMRFFGVHSNTGEQTSYHLTKNSLENYIDEIWDDRRPEGSVYLGDSDIPLDQLDIAVLRGLTHTVIVSFSENADIVGLVGFYLNEPDAGSNIGSGLFTQTTTETWVFEFEFPEFGDYEVQIEATITDNMQYNVIDNAPIKVVPQTIFASMTYLSYIGAIIAVLGAVMTQYESRAD